MGVEESLAAKKKLIERELRRLLSGDRSALLQAMRYMVLSGGKRFRPLLLLSSGACFGVRRSVLLPFACALELIHNSSLIHDDLPALDNDDFRRGRPACHRKFGEAMAILAGDGLLTLAFEVLARAPVPQRYASRKLRAIQTIGQAAGPKGMIGGQCLDIAPRGKKLTEKRFAELVQKKTGALIVAAVEVGAILGGAGRAARQSIRDFGRKVGLALQVRDDILDHRAAERNKGASPDYVTLVGMAAARHKLETLVHQAAASLDGLHPRAGELRHLAFSLLDPSLEVSHAQDT